MIRIEVFASPGCRRYQGTVGTVQNIAKDIGADRVAWRRIDVFEEIDYAVALGALTTPAVAIDGDLVFTAAPSAKGLRAAVDSRIKENPEEQRSEGREQ